MKAEKAGKTLLQQYRSEMMKAQVRMATGEMVRSHHILVIFEGRSNRIC